MVLVKDELTEIFDLKIPHADAEVRASGLYVVDNLAREPLVHSKLDVFCPAATNQKIGNPVGNEIAAVGIGGNRDDASAFVGKGPEIRFRVFRGPQNRLGVSCKDFAGRRQFQALSPSNEKFCVKRLLELLNPLGSTCVRHVHPLGALYQTAFLRRRQEERQIRKVIMKTRLHP